MCVKGRIGVLVIVLLAGACTSRPQPVVIGLDGREFFEPQRSADEQARLEEKLLQAKLNFDNDPSEDNYIWYGRRTAYLYRFPKAIGIYSEGLNKYPSSYRLLRHRGHRYISTRRFDDAITDLTQAASLVANKPIESEPDGQPNYLNIPKSTTQSNIWHHLGLAYYMKHDYVNAARIFEECIQKYVDNDDLLVANVDWLFITYHRLGRKEDAERILERISPKLNVIESQEYLKRLLMYKGLIDPGLLLAIEEGVSEHSVALATQGYGLGNWYLIQGDTTRAINTFKKVVSSNSFTAFGFIAAEADLLVLH